MMMPTRPKASARTNDKCPELVVACHDYFQCNDEESQQRHKGTSDGCSNAAFAALCTGPPEVRLRGKPPAFPTRKILAPLIDLATLLWPEASPERSYASLGNTLNRLQTALRQTSDQAPCLTTLTERARIV